MTSHPTHTTLVMPTAQADQIHADLSAAVAPMGDRHFNTGATHTIDGTDHTRVAWVVRPSVAVALADLAETYDLSVNPRSTPHVELTYPPLPDTGEPVEAGRIYAHDGGLVQARQTHDRTEHAPSEVLALFVVYRSDADGLDWIAAETVKVGDVRAHDGSEWRCIQGHTTQAGWEPSATPSLWVKLTPIADEPDDGGTTEWTAGEAVSVGDVRSYDGTDYECLQAHTTQTGWEPPSVPALWSPL